VTRVRVSVPLTLFLLLMIGGMTYLALDFNAQARRVPIVVGVPTTAILAIQLLRDSVALRRGIDDGSGEFGNQSADQEFGQSSARAALAEAGRGDGQEVAGDASDASSATSTRPEPPAMRAGVGQSFAWVLFLGFAFYVFGMLLAVPVFVGSFMRIYGRESWRVVIISVGSTVAVLYFFFVALLGIRLFPGLVGPLVGL